MLPSRYVLGQQDGKKADRKSRPEVRPSLLPKPRRPYSTERHSTEARGTSTAGQRSSSAEPPRHTLAVPRLSREASASKLPKKGRPRSQQGDRFMTPLRSSQYPGPMMTPRTPSEDRGSRKWQICLERALAFVTMRDERPVSNAMWQRAEMSRVAEALAARGARDHPAGAAGGGGAGAGGGAGGGGMALVRPLTIARFVEITGALLAALNKDIKLTTDNYVTKLPHVMKRLLYPGTVNKSWLKTVNTLHAFPHALALVSYLLDLVNHVELPVSDDWFYKDKSELACLRRDYLYKCWIRFQSPVQDFDDIDQEYLLNLKNLLGCDDEKFQELHNTIKKYSECLADEEEAAAREGEARLRQRVAELATDVKELRADRTRARADTQALRHRAAELAATRSDLDADIERASAERSRLGAELEAQQMSVSERTRLLDEVDYAARVRDSKQALAHQVAKMVQNKETELALWQKKTLDSCVEYKQGLIHLSAQFPDLASLAIDEKELMEPECSERVGRAVLVLRELAARLAERRAEHARNKTKLARQRTALIEEVRAKVAEVKSSVAREQQALESELGKEKAEAATCAAELHHLHARLEELRSHQDHYLEVDRDLDYWEAKEATMRAKLTELEEYVKSQREKSALLLQAARSKREQRVLDLLQQWNQMI